jgi:hypothetical protein
MPFIPRQVKPPARITITCKVLEETATMLKRYAEFLDNSTQEHVIDQALQLTFRRCKEFRVWLAATYPKTQTTERDSPTRLADPARRTSAIAGPRATTPAVPDPRAERARA